MKKTFYRVGNQNNEGLWYDSKGNLTGLIHSKYKFCKSSSIAMPFNQAVVGYLSATETMEELAEWFPVEDMKELELHGYKLLEYEATDFRCHEGHWLIHQSSSKIIRGHSAEDFEKYLNRKKTILEQEEIYPSQKGAFARAKKYAEMKTKYCTSCERDYPIEKMQEGKTKCKECHKDLERIRNRKRNR